MADRRGDYRIYLLTVWRNEDGRFSFILEDPRTGERSGFADIDALAAGLPDVVARSRVDGVQPDPPNKGSLSDTA